MPGTGRRVREDMYKLAWFVPESHLEATKAAVFEAGAGRVGDYDHCCWQVRGEGQFRPLPGSDPFIGAVGRLQKVAEYRVELVCSDAAIDAAVAALKHAHPYQTPAYEVWRLADF